MTHDPSSWSKFLVQETRTRNLDPSFAYETHKKLVREKDVRRLDENAVAAVVLLSMMNDNKRHVVVAQTARSRCKVGLLSVQYV